MYPVSEEIKQVQFTKNDGSIDGYKVFCNDESLSSENPATVTIVGIAFSNSKVAPAGVNPLDLSAAQAGSGTKDTITKNIGGGITINGESQSIMLKLPVPLAKGKQIKIGIKGSLSDESKGFRLYTSSDAYSGQSNQYTEMQGIGAVAGEFEKQNITLTATEDSQYLLIRTPNVGPSSVLNGVTITEVMVEYV